ncbi:MAG: cysteine--tRNA ligase [Candidatus Omnitrophica bacterium]|nr:cysteine--tRNA ligase [Candidatus Omnitrophota bacterium]
MSLRLYNTLSRTLEAFVPLDPEGSKVGIYVCGPTVYDDPHIGHARSAYLFDVLRRYLKHRGYDVTFVRNVTDVDDKIIEKARQEFVAWDAGRGAEDLKAKCREVADRYLKSYHEALGRLGIAAPDIEPKATEHVIPDSQNVETTKQIDASMTGFIGQLMTKNMAYQAGGDVYFPVRKFAEYGTLSNRSLDELQAGARVEPEEQKEDPLDFALWKAAKPDEPSWNSPWGPGRPGWHIECSVMSIAYLGDAFDIHGGGVDLVFPHHENEVAQARALGKPFAKYWMHNGLLTVKGEKMSKSLGNFVTIEQALRKAGNADVLKVFFLGTHYRKPIDYAEANVEMAEKRFSGLWHFLGQAKNCHLALAGSRAIPEQVARLRERFVQVMDDDLNTPGALAVLDKLVELGHRWIESWRERKSQWQQAHPGELLDPGDDPNLDALQGHIDACAAAVEELGAVLGVTFRMGEVSDEANVLFEEYKAARARKDFQTSDQKRRLLQEKGFTIQDTSTGSIMLPKR